MTANPSRLRRAAPAGAARSPPGARQARFDRRAVGVAQLVEQYTFNVWVLGSNPSQVTSKFVQYDFFAYVVKLVDTPS